MEKREVQFEKQSFATRLKSMLKVDFRRTFTTPLFYIMIGVCFVIPILILIMTTAMDGTVSVDPQTGKETVIEGFDFVWQAISPVSGSSGGMDLTSMCNINMLYFLIAVFVCLFVSADFKSGYAKNLFTVRAKKNDYAISKTLVGLFAGACMLIAYFFGTVLGGKLSGLSFALVGASKVELVTCMLAKIALVGVFVPIFLAVSVAAKQKTWLSIVGSLAAGMLLYSMVPIITPLDCSIVNALMCVVGGGLFCVGIGAVSNVILKKTSLV
ncbi:MAG: ABC transporter permease [Clostridia bacterium]|nr:ABC transporter permease [Clostridia bacterium]